MSPIVCFGYEAFASDSQHTVGDIFVCGSDMLTFNDWVDLVHGLNHSIV